jgi:hypothetical protein
VACTPVLGRTGSLFRLRSSIASSSASGKQPPRPPMKCLLFSWLPVPRQTQAHRQLHDSEVAVTSLLLARCGQVFVRPIGWLHQPAGSGHRCHIIFVRDSTIEAHLIILAMSPSMRPGEPMRAESCQEPVEELECHPEFNPCRGELARHLFVSRTKVTHNV